MSLTTIFEHSNSQPLAFFIALAIAFFITPIIKERANLLPAREAEPKRYYNKLQLKKI